MKEIKVVKTPEVLDEMWQTIVSGFNECFPDHKKSKDEFVERYKTNPIGYCYHAIYYEDGVLGGFNSITPMVYNVDGEDVIMGQSGDTFILPQYRKDMLLFKRIYNKLKEVCAKDGVIAFLGVPNPNSYRYSTKILGCKEVLQLNYWILPVKIGNIIKRYRWLNVISPIYAYSNLLLNKPYSFLFNHKEKNKRIHVKIDDGFLNKRFSAKHYTNVINAKYRFSYTITNDEGIRCAYIMNVGENGRRSTYSLYKCLSYILHNEKVDMMMFCGTMNMKQGMLIKTPHRFEPRTLHFTVDILTREYEERYSILLDGKEWEYSLLNLDVR